MKASFAIRTVLGHSVPGSLSVNVRRFKCESLNINVRKFKGKGLNIKSLLNYVPTCHNMLRANVPTCLRAKFSYVPTCHDMLRANVPTCQIFLRANVP